MDMVSPCPSALQNDTTEKGSRWPRRLFFFFSFTSHWSWCFGTVIYSLMEDVLWWWPVSDIYLARKWAWVGWPSPGALMQLCLGLRFWGRRQSWSLTLFLFSVGFIDSWLIQTSKVAFDYSLIAYLYPALTFAYVTPNHLRNSSA